MRSVTRRSAAPAWVALVGLVLAWDLVAPRLGFETMSSCWGRWRRSCPAAATGLAMAVSWLDHHLEGT